MNGLDKPDRIALGVLVFFALVHGLVSFPNHALFRTYALDLGLYTHALWHYAHGSIHDSSLFLADPQPILADHFDLYLPLFSPLVFVLGTWTLLVVQWVAVVLGAWGLRRFLLQIGSTLDHALLGMVIFLLYFGVFAAMAFDYHSNVVSAMVLPWFLLALSKKETIKSVILFLFMLIGKENMGFWLGPLALILAFDPIFSKAMRRTAAALGGFGLIYSFAMIGWVMPSLSPEGAYAHFDYSILGASINEVPGALFGQPLEIVKGLFSDHRGVPKGTEIKLEFWWMMILSGGWAFILRPRWGLMALPLIAQKMWHDDPGKWSVIAQYGVEFAPLLGVAVPLALARHGRMKYSRWVPITVVALALFCTIRFMDRTVAYHDRSRIRIYQAQHYVKSYDLDALREVLAKIPRDASVSAQSPAVPQLALRDRLYQFPIIREADHILLMPLESPYPLDSRSYRAHVRQLIGDPQWDLVVDRDEVILFERVQYTDQIR